MEKPRFASFVDLFLEIQVRIEPCSYISCHNDRSNVSASYGKAINIYFGKLQSDLVKIKNRSRKRSHMRDGIGVRRIRTFPFLPTPSLTFRLGSSENQIFGVGSRSGRINQWQSTFPRFFVDLALLLLLPTPTTGFHHRSQAERKRRSRKRNEKFLQFDWLRAVWYFS